MDTVVEPERNIVSPARISLQMCCGDDAPQ